MKFDIYRTNRTRAVCNTTYPIHETISNAADFQRAVKYDHIPGKFTDNVRSADRFLFSNVIVMDCDNSHSDDPCDWITVEEFQKEFKPFNYVIVYSRHNMKDRGDECARPRFHVYFPISECRDKDKYLSLKITLQKAHPYFDEYSLDVARFFFGAENPSVIWVDDGWNIDEIVRGSDGRKVGRKGKSADPDWREWRKVFREKCLRADIGNLTATAEEEEEIITEVENEDVSLISGRRSMRMVNGDVIDTMSLSLEGDGRMTLEVGTNGSDGEDGAVYIGIEDSGVFRAVNIETKKTGRGEMVSLSFSGKKSVPMAYAMLKSIYLLLKKAEAKEDKGGLR